MTHGDYIKKLPVSTVLDLKQFITIGNSQVSSMTLVQRPNLAMTLLSLDTGTSIGGHSSPGDALVHVLSGETEITIGPDKYTVRTGETIVMPANVSHALYAVEAFQMLLVVVKPND